MILGLGLRIEMQPVVRLEVVMNPIEHCWVCNKMLPTRVDVPPVK